MERTTVETINNLVELSEFTARSTDLYRRDGELSREILAICMSLPILIDL